MIKPHASSLRRGRYSEVNRIYLITTVTECREHVFDDLVSARIVINTLKEEQSRGCAFCINARSFALVNAVR